MLYAFDATQISAWGWRVAFGIGGAAAIVVFWLRRTMDESLASASIEAAKSGGARQSGSLHELFVHQWRPLLLLAATAAARHADINRPDSLERAALTDDGKLWLKGVIPGYRAMVDLNGEVADSRQSLAKLSELDDPMVTQLAQTPSQRLG